MHAGEFNESATARKISRLACNSTDLKEFLLNSLGEIMRALACDAGFFHLITAQEKSLRFLSRGLSRETAALLRNAPGESFTKNQSGTPAKAMRSDGLQSFLFHPIHAENRVIGYIGLGRKDGIISKPGDFFNICVEIIGITIAKTWLREQSDKLHNDLVALQDLFQAVSRSQKSWETTFDAMQDCVSVHDTEGKIIRANSALARRLSTTPQAVVGRYCSEIYNPSTGGRKCCRHMRHGKPEDVVTEEIELTAMNGFFQISISPWYDKNNQVAGFIHIAKDISNEKLLQQQLIQSEKLSAIGGLISGIAHELNNPLTGVMGYAQLLQLRRDIDDKAKESLSKINSLAVRCQKIVQNLLSFARKKKPERILSDINEILNKTLELRNYDMQINNIELIAELEQELPGTIADAHQLQQVFLNIITNAEQAILSSRRQGRVTIRTRSNHRKGYITVEIIDNGPGIPEKYHMRIFDPFFTTKEVGNGTGLGLSLSYGIIKEHGGDIFVKNRPGRKGAHFVIEIPVIRESGDTQAAPRGLSPDEQHFTDTERVRKILMVDDEKYILDFLTEVFHPLLFDVDTATDSQTALNKIQSCEYDLVITDYRMPHMNGGDLFNWVKENRPSLVNRIVFMTGDTVNPETYSFFKDNRIRYLTKPFKIEEIKNIVAKTLGDLR